MLLDISTAQTQNRELEDKFKLGQTMVSKHFQHSNYNLSSTLYSTALGS